MKDLDDKLQHWGIKGMEWKKHKKKKDNNDLKDRIKSFLKKAKSKTKRGLNKAEKEGGRAIGEGKKVAKKAEKEGQRVIRRGKHQVAKLRKHLAKTSHKRSGSIHKKKPAKYTVDFAKQDKQKREKADAARWKKVTSEVRRMKKDKAVNDHWKKVRDGKKDTALTNHWKKVKKEQASRAANKDKAVNDHWKKVGKTEADKAARKERKQKAVDKYWKNYGKSKSKKKSNDNPIESLLKKGKKRVNFAIQREKNLAKAQKKAWGNVKKDWKDLTTAEPKITVDGVEMRRTKSGKLVPKDKKVAFDWKMDELATRNPSSAASQRLNYGLTNKQKRARLKKLWKNVPDA